MGRTDRLVGPRAVWKTGFAPLVHRARLRRRDRGLWGPGDRLGRGTSCCAPQPLETYDAWVANEIPFRPPPGFVRRDEIFGSFSRSTKEYHAAFGGPRVCADRPSATPPTACFNCRRAGPDATVQASFISDLLSEGAEFGLFLLPTLRERGFRQPRARFAGTVWAITDDIEACRAFPRVHEGADFP